MDRRRLSYIICNSCEAPKFSAAAEPQSYVLEFLIFIARDRALRRGDEYLTLKNYILARLFERPVSNPTKDQLLSRMFKIGPALLIHL